MARSLNTVHLIGRVGGDPEVRTTQGGSKVATLSLATSEQWKDQAGNKQERTQWHRVVVWNMSQRGGLADVAESYVKKGEMLFVAGQIDYREWTDKEGQKRNTTEIKANQLLLLGGKTNSAAEPTTPRQPPTGTGRPNSAPREEPEFPTSLEDEADDLPF